MFSKEEIKYYPWIYNLLWYRFLFKMYDDMVYSVFEINKYGLSQVGQKYNEILWLGFCSFIFWLHFQNQSSVWYQKFFPHICIYLTVKLWFLENSKKKLIRNRKFWKKSNNIKPHFLSNKLSKSRKTRTEYPHSKTKRQL